MQRVTVKFLKHKKNLYKIEIKIGKNSVKTNHLKSVYNQVCMRLGERQLL